jgi:tryptophan-rich sensory protein
MAVTSKRERALQVVLVVLGLGTAGANIYPLVTYFLAGPRPTGGTTAPMFYTILAALGVFLVLAARNPSAHRSLIAYAVWSSFAHTAVMALMAMQLPTKRGELLAGVAVTGLSALLLFVLAPRKETALATS